MFFDKLLMFSEDQVFVADDESESVVDLSVSSAGSGECISMYFGGEVDIDGTIEIQAAEPAPVPIWVSIMTYYVTVEQLANGITFHVPKRHAPMFKAIYGLMAGTMNGGVVKDSQTAE